MAGKSTPIAHLDPLELIPEPAEQPTRVGLPVSLLGPIRDCPDVPGYDILAELGRGGMGVVYLARQLRLKRVVALKMLRPGLHTEAEARLRFAGEAQAVAQLRHPHIVQIYEVGEAAGRPYLALEFVEGGNLAQFQAGKPQPPALAAQLIELLARAVHHAHEHGVIHRDLKPSNVLMSVVSSPLSVVSRSGQRTIDNGQLTPKITDFGLAKQLSDDSHLTRTGCALGTPSYMAPELAVGMPGSIGPAVDIYGLGTILYELLTGRPPFTGATDHETLTQVVCLEPVPPRRLQPGVPRDLETICLTCLQKQAPRRYPSAAALAEDIQCFLSGQPIQARPVGLIERSWKWSKRRPAVTSLLFTLALVLVGSFVGLMWLWQRAEDQAAQAQANFRLAQSNVDRLLVEVSERDLRHEDLPAVRRKLIQEALGFFEQFATERANDLQFQLALAGAYRRLADLETDLADYTGAERHYAAAEQVLHAAAARFAGHADVREAEATLRGMRAILQQGLGRTDLAEADFRAALATQQELVDARPTNVDLRRRLALYHFNLGALFMNTGRPAQAEQHCQAALELRRRLTTGSEPRPRDRRCLASSLHQVSRLDYLRQRLDEAETNCGEAILLLERIGTERGDEDVQEFASAYAHLARLMGKTDRPNEGCGTMLLALDQFESLVQRFPNVPGYRDSYATGWNDLGSMQKDLGQYSDARDSYVRAAAAQRRLMHDSPQVPGYKSALAATLNNLALASNRLGETAEARRLLEEAVHLQTEAIHGDPRQVTFQGFLRNHYGNLSDVLLKLDDLAGAAEAIERFSQLFPERPYDAWYAAVQLAEITHAAQEASASSGLGSAEVRHYGNRAMCHLFRAQQLGFLRKAEPCSFLAESPEFCALRDRPDFQHVLNSARRDLDAPP